MHGPQVRRVAKLAPLGLSPIRHLQVKPLGHLIALEHNGRLVLLRKDGSLFAATHFLYRNKGADGLSGASVEFAHARSPTNQTRRLPAARSTKSLPARAGDARRRTAASRPTGSIVAVQYRGTNLAGAGYLQLSLRGGSEAKGALRQARRDENTVMWAAGVPSYWRKKNAEFAEARDLILEKISAAAARSSACHPYPRLYARAAATSLARYEDQRLDTRADHRVLPTRVPPHWPCPASARLDAHHEASPVRADSASAVRLLERRR